MDISKLFKLVTAALAEAGLFLRKGVVDADIDVAADLVAAASAKFVDNASRREWAVDQLVARLGVPESIARWLVETAVLRLKAEAKRRQGTAAQPE